MDQGRQAGGEDDPPLLSSFPLKPGAASAEPAGLQPGQFVAAASPAQTDRELVADESATTAGEDGRMASGTCTLLLAIAGGMTSEPAAARGDAGPDRTVAGADGIEREGGRVCIGIGLTGGWARRSVAKAGRNMEQFRQCWYESHTERGSPNENRFTMSRTGGMGVQ